MPIDYTKPAPYQTSPVGRLIRFCLLNKLAVALMVVFLVATAICVAPFDWDLGGMPRYPVATDAIPDIGENQQIVFTPWPGRTPQDVDDQITYNLTNALMGVPGVKTIRGNSFFGFSSIYIIFHDDVDFYWARSRILEKLNSLPANLLPEGVQPALGPDATALGQVFWYTLEGRDRRGRPAGGWDLEELRKTQDWYVRYSLQSAQGVSEVASVGGFVREYQIDVDPDAMRAYGVTLPQIYAAIKASNIDVGARSIELNRVEYFVRGVGFVKRVEDLEDTVVKVSDNIPITIKQIANVGLGPAMRRGALDKDGAEAVGGVVVCRYGANPLSVIKNVKDKAREISQGLPAKVIFDHEQVSRPEIEVYAQRHGFEAFVGSSTNHQAWVEHLRSVGLERSPKWACISQMTIVPFYDRTGLIYETLGTLSDALAQEILVTFIVVILMLMHLRSSMLIGGMLPLAVGLCLVAMKVFGVDANIVALSGIAIAIGTIVDMGIVICENILKHLDQAPEDVPRLEVVHRAASEVGSAVLTAVATTVISFLPVFTMIGAEGKLFRPLAFTKTFALIASVMIALTVLPPAAMLAFSGRISGRKMRIAFYGFLTGCGVWLIVWGIGLGSLLIPLAGGAVVLWALWSLLGSRLPAFVQRWGRYGANLIIVVLVGMLLSGYWEPLGAGKGDIRNFLFVAILVGSFLTFFWLFRRLYPRILACTLRHKIAFLSVVMVFVIWGSMAWLGMERMFGWLPVAGSHVGVPEQTTRSRTFWVNGTHAFPGLGKEFMPPLDEGSFLYMPTTMVHASMGEALDILSKQDMAFRSIPEIDTVVGKIGRVDSPLDPAPISMVETVINYKPEYVTDKDGRRLTFRYDSKRQRFARDARGRLIPDPDGKPKRQWRDHIKTADDIWDEIVKAGAIPGSTSAPKLQPIAARIVMLQSGMRAPMGIKVKGPNLETIERVGLKIEKLLKEVPTVKADAVIADRIIGKPYLEIIPDRQALKRYNIDIRRFQDVVEVAIGGKRITSTVEGRERFPVRVRYPRELRDSVEAMSRILFPGEKGVQIPLAELAEIRYVRGPQVIKSEDTFKTGYVLFDKKDGYAEVDVVQQCQDYLQRQIDRGRLVIPAGVSYEFAGSYKNQVRAQKTLAFVLPMALFAIFVILYFQFRHLSTVLLVFSGIFVAWSGGFILIWLYGQDWFLDFSLFGVSMRSVFQVHPINLSVAVWVGFLALFGIASDDGVLMGTYLHQTFDAQQPKTKEEIRQAVVYAGSRRIRPCLMTTATTILALLPVLTSTGRGADVMVPMAIPSFGGMLIEVLTMLVVPVLYCLVKEVQLKREHGAD